MPSSKAESTRDWGKGMACVGRTKECTLVEKNHFGPIPGVEVGTCWKYRLQVNIFPNRYPNQYQKLFKLHINHDISISYISLQAKIVLYNLK